MNRVSAEYLPMMAAFMAKNDVRWYLNGMLIEKAGCGGAYLVATDGHALLVVHDEQAVVSDAPMIVPLSKLLVAQSKDARRAEFDGKRVTLFAASKTVELIANANEFRLTLPAEEITGRAYPNWRDVFPATEMEYGPALVNRHLLARIAAIEFRGARRTRYLANPILHCAGANAGKIVVRFEGRPNVVALVMQVAGKDLLGSVVPFAPAAASTPTPTDPISHA